MIARQLPHSIDDEEFLIGCCLIDGADVIAKCVLAGITPSCFYEPKNGLIFSTMLGLYSGQKPTDVSAVASELMTTRQIEAAGGFPFLAQVSSRITTTAQAGFFIEKVKQWATLREMIRACTSAVEDCYNFSGGLEELSTSIANRVSRASGLGSEESEEKFQVVAKALLAEVEAPLSEQKPPVGEISWGLVDIDKACGRMCPGNLVVLAGMPSTGKSALADQVAWNTASKGEETIIFTYEMTKREKAVRMAQQVSRLNYDQFRSAPPDRRATFTAAVRAISECKNLHVYERDISAGRMMARCQALANEGKKIGLIVVDFLQYLARLEPTIGRERTDEKIGRITGACKDMSKKFSCPVMLLSSLNREGYRDGNRPTLASLKASGDIESDADIVAILHWPKESPDGQIQDPHDPYATTFYVEFNQDKGRSKGVHQIGMHFDRHATRFNNYIR